MIAHKLGRFSKACSNIFSCCCSSHKTVSAKKEFTLW